MQEETVKDLLAFGFIGTNEEILKIAEMIDSVRVGRFWERLREIWNLHILLLLADVKHTITKSTTDIIIHIENHSIRAWQSERTQGKVWLYNDGCTSEQSVETGVSAFERIMKGYPYDK
jgi:hypothetical protein